MFRDGIKDGSDGWLRFSDGSAYYGNIVGGLFEGEGKFNCSQGDNFVGMFSNGKMHGAGEVRLFIVYESDFMLCMGCGDSYITHL